MVAVWYIAATNATVFGQFSPDCASSFDSIADYGVNILANSAGTNMTTVAFESAGQHFSGTLQGIYPFVFVRMLLEIGCSFRI